MTLCFQSFRSIAYTLLVLFSFTFCYPALAETKDFSSVITAIKDSKLDEAEQMIDRILNTEPNNVDALMYKGNILYYRGSNSGAIQLYGNEEESIYDSSIGFIGEGSSLVAAEVAKQVATYFKRALQQAPQRMDIQMGLCWVYANAGLKDELIERFPHLQKHGDRDGLQYNMGDYARIIANDYSLQDGVAVYHAITALYPNDGNLLSDIGAVYFQHGDLTSAVNYFTRAASMSQRDEMTLANLVLINAVAGDYEKSLYYQELVSEMTGNDRHLLYRALQQRLAGAPSWQEHANAFIARHPGDDENKPYKDMAHNLLPKGGGYSYDQYKASSGHKVETHFDILNTEWAVKAFPDKFEPAFELADLLTYYHNYAKAMPLYARIEQQQLATTQNERDKLHFYYAWALYSAGHSEEARQHWKSLLTADNFYYKSAACYFLGNYHYQRKELKQAANYFKQVKDGASKSKYANFASNIYRRIKQ